MHITPSTRRIIGWVLFSIGGALILMGLVLIFGAKQIAELQYGPNYSMADLGNIVSGMLWGAIGLVLFIVGYVLSHLPRR